MSLDYYARIVSEAYKSFSFDSVRNFFMRCPNNVVFVGDSVCMYLNLCDDSLAKVRSGEYNLCDKSHLDILFKESGRNVHIFGLVSRSVKEILKFKKFFKGAKSLSWFSPDMTKFNYFERS